MKTAEEERQLIMRLHRAAVSLQDPPVCSRREAWLDYLSSGLQCGLNRVPNLSYQLGSAEAAVSAEKSVGTQFVCLAAVEVQILGKSSRTGGLKG
jgi:hypothetical protein